MGEVLTTAEMKFQEWLEHKRYPYVNIEQSRETFSKLFRGKVKRPDFLVLIDSVGLLAVEVKDKELYEEYETFAVDEKGEIQRLLIFERSFRIPVWFAFSNVGVGYRTWYWISLSEVLEKIPTNVSKKSGEEFRGVPIKECITIGWDDGLWKLFRGLKK